MWTLKKGKCIIHYACNYCFFADIFLDCSGLTFASLFELPMRPKTPKLASLDVAAEDIYNKSVWSTSPNKKSNLKKKKRKKEPIFNPRFDDYDVMRNRWNYLRPYTLLLNNTDKLNIPSNATDKWVRLDTLPLPVFGNIADAMYFENRVGSPMNPGDTL